MPGVARELVVDLEQRQLVLLPAVVVVALAETLFDEPLVVYEQLPRGPVVAPGATRASRVEHPPDEPGVVQALALRRP